MDQELLKKIRENVDIVEFIGKYVPLIKRGKNYFGLCPFHNDTNPSLSVSRDKQIYKCFVCGEAGNIFNFLMKFENISFKEAARIIGNDVGISVFDNYKKEENKYQVNYDIYEIANKFYQNNLLSKEGAKAREYLEKRQLDRETIKEFQIGLSLYKRDLLTNLLLKKGYSLSLLEEAGLVSEDHDIYVKRIIFPLFNIKGEVNGFSGRIYNGEHTNKYLNSKETPIFKKGENLFNYHKAKDEVRKMKYVILMEGFMAVIRAYTIGIKNCIATMGTSLTLEQINLIKKLTDTVYLCLDGDNAGIKATLKNGKMLLDNNIHVKVISLSDNLDPDDYILKYGEERFKGLLENPISYHDFRIKVLKRGVDFNSATDKAKYINSVLEEISLETDEIKREIMLKNLAKETNVWYNTLEKKLNGLLSNQKEVSENTFTQTFKYEKKKKDKYMKTMENILYYMVNKREVITLVNNSHVYFPIEEYRVLSREISYYYDKYGSINMADFSTYLMDKETLYKLFQDIISLDLDINIENEVILEYISVIKNYNVALEIKRLENLIMNEVDPDLQAKISNQILTLIQNRE